MSLGRAFGRLIMLLVLIGVLAGTGAALLSDTVFKRVWFPRIAKVFGLQADVRYARWDLLRGFTVEQVSLRSPDGWSGTVDRIEVAYDLRELQRGVLMLSQIRVRDGSLVCDGTALAERPTVEPGKKSPVPLRRSASAGVQIKTGPIELENLSVEWKFPTNGRLPRQATMRLAHLTMDQFDPGKTTQVTGSCQVRGLWDRTLELRQAQVDLRMKLELDADFHFRDGDGTLNLSELDGRSGEVPLNGHRLAFTFDLDPYRLKVFRAQVFKGDTLEGQLEADGFVDFNVHNADLLIRIKPVTSELASLFTAPSGLLMTAGTVSASGQFAMTKDSYRFQGEGFLARATLARAGRDTPLPEMDGQFTFATEIFPEANQTQLDRFDAKLLQNGNPFAEITLNQPVRMAWGEHSTGVGDAELKARIFPTDLNVFREAWTGLRDFDLAKGRIAAEGKVTAGRGGRDLRWEGNGELSGVSGKIQGMALSGVDLRFATRGNLAEFERLTVDELVFSVADPAAPRGEIRLTGSRTPQSGKFNAVARGDLAWLGGMVPVFRQLHSGTFQATCEINWPEPGTMLSQFKLDSLALSGTLLGLGIENGTIHTEGEWLTSGNESRLSGLAITVQPRIGVPAGKVLAQGHWRHDADVFQMETQIQDWDAANLVPLLAPKGSSVIASAGPLKGQASWKRENGTQTLDVYLSGEALRIVEQDRANLSQSAPTNLILSLRGKGDVRRMELSEGYLQLTPREGFNNQLTIQGWVETSDRWSVKLAGEALDLSPVAGLFRVSKKKTAPSSSPSQTVAAAPAPAPSATRSSGKASKASPPSTPTTSAPAALASAPKQNDTAALPNAVSAILSYARMSPKPQERAMEVQISLDCLRLPPYPDLKLDALTVWRNNILSVAPFEAALGEGTAVGSLTWDVGTGRMPFRLLMKLQKWPLAPFQPLVSEAARSGMTGDITLDLQADGETASSEAWDKAQRGRASLEWTHAQIEKTRPMRQLLDAVGRYFSNELASGPISLLRGNFEWGDGSIRTDNLRVEGDQLQLAASGKMDWDQSLSAEVTFSGKTETLQAADVRMGPVTVGGATFVTFGKNANGYTTLPGFLPVRGKVPDQITADWEGWLASIGVDSATQTLQGFLQNLLPPKGKEKAPKKSSDLPNPEEKR
jgi:hypothetical protein